MILSSTPTFPPRGRPHGRSLESLDEVCSHVNNDFDALLKVSPRKTWPIFPGGKALEGSSSARSLQERLQAAKWRYERILELWRVGDGHGTGQQSVLLQDWFEERLVRLSRILTELRCAVRGHRKLFADDEASLSSLGEALESLDEAMLTCSLCAKVDELISEDFAGAFLGSVQGDD
jgi:hypothetical protein